MTARFWLPIVFGLGKIAFALILIFVIFVAFANGQEKTQMEGTYFVPLTSGDIHGNTYHVVDYLSVVQIYEGYQVDVLTNFFNGHTCSFSGVMQRVLENRLEFDGKKDFPRQDCELGITWGKDEIVFDALGCRASCGTRGGLIGATFPIASRNQPPLDNRTDAELCEYVFRGESTYGYLNLFSEYEQILLFVRGVDLLTCREMLQ